METEDSVTEGWGIGGKKGMDPMKPRHKLRRTPPGKKGTGRREPSATEGEADGETTDAGASSVASTDSKRKRVTGGDRESESDTEEESRKSRRV